MRENRLTHTPTSTIIITREQRQRSDLTLDSVLELAQSIGRTGNLIQPISVNRDNLTIIAGERRLTAFIALEHALRGDWTPFADPASAREILSPVCECHVKQYDNWAAISTLLYHDVTALDLQIIEWSENIHRVDLPWQDRAKAALAVHKLCLASANANNERWTDAQTAAALSISPSGFSQLVSPLRELAAATPKTRASVEHAIESSGTALSASRSAVSIKTRHGEQSVARSAAGAVPLIPREQQEGPSAPPVVSQLVCADFLEWAPQYSGPQFNFIHFDPPYGIEFNSSGGQNSAASTKQVGTYDDSERTYFDLLGTLLAQRSRLLAPSAHIMFWFSQNLRRETEDRIMEVWPDAVISKFLLVWHMSDNSGLLPTPKEGRRTYETAFQITLGQRPLATPRAMSFSAPRSSGPDGTRGQKIHRSQKQLAVLEHFLPQYVDTSTRMLDPTAGSATSLIAAHRLGASVLGLEIDPEMHTLASAHFAQETSAQS